MRTLLVGVDGACLPVLTPMIEDGLLTNIASLQKEGITTPLESQLPPWTPSAWPSLYTGVNPGKHGVYDFLHFDGYDWDVVNRSHVMEFSIWELLSMEGYRSVVLNVPVTGPPSEFDGILVPGYTAPEEPDCHPQGIWNDLNRELGEYRLYNESLSTGASEQERKLGYEQLTELRGAAFRYLVNEYDPDFGFVQFQQTDTVFHEFPNDKETIRRVYSTADTEIGDIIDVCDPDTTLLVSDHGIGPMNGCEFRVNGCLRDEGLLNVIAGEGGMPSWKSISRNRLRSGEDSRLANASFAERVFESTAKIGLTSQRIHNLLKRLGIDDTVRQFVPTDLIRAGTERVDFESSKVYMRSRTEMGIRLNVEGREPNGVVSKSQYNQVREEVIQILEQVTVPSGAPVFEQVLPREKVFLGPYLEEAPDIVTIPYDFEHYLSASVRQEMFGEPNEPWEHKLEGVLIAAGDEISPESELSDPHLFDIAPTVLASFDLAVNSRMDGSPLPIVEDTGTTEYPPFETSGPIKMEGNDVAQRLFDLGYLE